MEEKLDVEQKKHRESQKESRKYERRTRELTAQIEQEKLSQRRIQDSFDQLQKKTAYYKRQSEEAQELAAVSLGKFRLMQNELDEVNERCDEPCHLDLTNRTTKNRRSLSFTKESSPSVSRICFNYFRKK